MSVSLYAARQLYAVLAAQAAVHALHGSPLPITTAFRIAVTADTACETAQNGHPAKASQPLLH